MGCNICSLMGSYWFEIGVKLRAVFRPVFNTLFLLEELNKAIICVCMVYMNEFFILHLEKI